MVRLMVHSEKISVCCSIINLYIFILTVYNGILPMISTWVKLAYHDTGCSPEGYIVYTLTYIKLDMQSARFPAKLFSITCGECHEYEGSPLICLERCGCLHCNGDFQNHVTCVTSGLPSWCHGVVMDNF